MSSALISDRDINNCNTRLSASRILVEPSNLWEIGKQVGLTYRREEEEVVKEYVFMEERDSEVVNCSKEGNKNGF